MIMESLTHHGYSGMNTGTRIWNFLQWIKSTELEAVPNVVWAQPEKIGKDFDATMSYYGQVVIKMGYKMQFVHIVKTGSQPAKPEVMSFIRKIEFKKYSKATWNSMTREQHMQVEKLWQQQGIKFASKKPSVDARFTTLGAQLGVYSQPEEGYAMKKERETLVINYEERNRGNSVVTCQTSGGKQMEPGWLLGSSKVYIDTRYVDKFAVSCAIVQTVQLSAWKSIAVV